VKIYERVSHNLNLVSVEGCTCDACSSDIQNELAFSSTVEEYDIFICLECFDKMKKALDAFSFEHSKGS